MLQHRPIRPPGPRLRSHVGLRWNRRSGGRRPLSASLQLTPLIDVFVVILLFLLVRFSPSGDCCGCVRPGYRLPLAEWAERLQRAPLVVVDRDGAVSIDGTDVAVVSELLSDESPDWNISRLTDELEAKKQLLEMTVPERPLPGTVIVAADESTDVKVLKKILYSCGLAGYADVHLAVEQPGREP